MNDHSITITRFGRIGIVVMAAMALAMPGAFAPADAKNKTRDESVYDPALEPKSQPQPWLKTPSLSNSEASSPVRRDYYRPLPDSGAIKDRLVPPSTIRPGPRGY